jgi:hypothetical protein
MLNYTDCIFENKMIKKIKRLYISSSIILQSTLILTLGINLTLFLIFLIRDALNENPVSEKYDKNIITETYPEKNKTQIERLLQETWSRGFKYEAYTQFSERAYTGEFVNVSKDGYRSNDTFNVWPPDEDKLNIFVFGGSTTFGYGVADNETIPSRLQSYLSKLNNRIIVYNFGRGFYYSTQEKILLELLISQNIDCDIAVFIDGLNEFIHLENEPIYTYHLNDIFLKNEKLESKYHLSQLISQTSIGRAQRFFTKFLNQSGKINNSTYNNKINKPDSKYFLNRYLFNKSNIQNLANFYNIKCLFVLQPIPSYKYDQSNHPFAKNGYGIHEHSSHAYSKFENEYLKDQNKSNFLWLGNLQEDLNIRLYVDLVHYTAYFNKLISKRISEQLISELFLND